MLPLLSWPLWFSKARSGHISVHIGKEDWFSFPHNMKTSKNLKDKSTNQVSTSYVGPVSEAPQMEIVNSNQPKAIARVMAEVLYLFPTEKLSI